MIYTKMMLLNTVINIDKKKDLTDVTLAIEEVIKR